MKHVHILGICGTFMGGLALLAREQGFVVSGCDQNVYPPMSTQLAEQGITLTQGFGLEQLSQPADMYVIGNAISRGNPLLEEILDRGLPYTSGPAFLSEQLLQGRWVLGVAGTHGKTTTSSMLAWILEYAGMAPGFLIGGIPQNFGLSARAGDSDFFVIEADEYDSAFFDKRSKMIHYRPRTFIFNNLEFDHADIFKDLAAIQTQFHHVVRTIPRNGRVIYPQPYSAIDEVLAQGVWCETQSFEAWQEGQDTDDEQVYWRKLADDGSVFEVMLGAHHARVAWSLTGDHNVCNGVAAMLAARHVGVEMEHCAAALSQFKGVKRRMEVVGKVGDVTVYDDFAHHPTAIASTLEGLRRRVGHDTIIGLIEPRSNTMKMGVHAEALLDSAQAADRVLWSQSEGMDWLAQQVADGGAQHAIGDSVEALIAQACEAVNQAKGAVHVVIMSNGGFGGIHQRLLHALEDVAS
ncbi:MAG: UDP-N-acetylmuramate:L-alanyl-gamma-D-glutamyl-meso-diaminopimelate ligase [Oleiphilaceae bacterium]|nr:UDP-N-acetylmuramate:L-alanyl-gamma-D-glutamyl-meso-diaminopimelate ligase [Oleiphilaceae bacterium]